MAEAAGLPLEYPETAVVCESTLAEQSLAVATVLPSRPARARRLLLRAHRGGRRSRGAPRADRGRVDRRPRRSQHPGELSQRQRVGHGSPHADRRRRGGTGGRGSRSARATSTRRRTPTLPRSDWSLGMRASSERSTARLRSTSRSTPTVSIRARAWRHSCPSRPGSPWPTRKRFCSASPPRNPLSAPVSPASSPSRGTSGLSRVSVLPWGSSRIRLVLAGPFGRPVE